MREKKFRGIATLGIETNQDGVQKGDIVEGYYYFCRARISGIIITDLHVESGGLSSGIAQVEIEVDYKTVGEYTGLKDKNGKEIFEGDVLVWSELNCDNEKTYAEIIWGDAEFLIKCCEDTELLSSGLSDNWIVIGNIHENPELLK